MITGIEIANYERVMEYVTGRAEILMITTLARRNRIGTSIMYTIGSCYSYCCIIYQNYRLIQLTIIGGKKA
jgi:hypothetical protein